MRKFTNGWKRSGLMGLVTMFLALAMITPTLAAGGSFSATDRGTSLRSGCGLLAGLRNCILTLNGQGTAISLGSVHETGRITADLRFLSGVLGGCGAAFGNITLSSRSNPNNSVRFAVSGQVCKGLLSLGRASYALTYRVTGGSGTFSHASGTGRVNGQANAGFLTGRGNYSDQFNGTLNF